MGKGTIISHLGAGQYRVTVETKRDKADAEIKRLQDLLTALTGTTIPAAEQALADAQDALKSYEDKLDTAIQELAGGAGWVSEQLYEAGAKIYIGLPVLKATAATPGRSGRNVPSFTAGAAVKEGVSWTGIDELGSGETWSADTYYDVGARIRMAGANYSMQASKAGYSGPTEPAWPGWSPPVPPDPPEPYPSLQEGLSWAVISTEDGVLAATRALMDHRQKRDAANLALDQLKARLLATQQRLAWLPNALPSVPDTRTIWCADLADGNHAPLLLPENPAATMEPTGDPDASLPILRPNYGRSGGYVARRDGEVTAAINGSTAAQYVNLATMPGWAKWRPQYRVGTIQSISGDQIVVAPDPVTVQHLIVPLSESGTITAGVKYMDCGPWAFKTGDRVVVEFTGQDRSKPVVIGFESHPRACPAMQFVCVPRSDDCMDGWGTPFSGGDRLGTCAGSYPERALAYDPVSQTWTVYVYPDYQSLYPTGIKYGEVDWNNPAIGVKLSWRGVQSRYFEPTPWENIAEHAGQLRRKTQYTDPAVITYPPIPPSQEYATVRLYEYGNDQLLLGPEIYRDGDVLASIPNTNVTGVDGYVYSMRWQVMGACVHQVGSQYWLLAMCKTDYRIALVLIERLVALELDSGWYPKAGAAWQEWWSTQPDHSVWYEPTTPWFFNASGSEAQAMRRKAVSNINTDASWSRWKLTISGVGSASFDDLGNNTCTDHHVAHTAETSAPGWHTYLVEASTAVDGRNIVAVDYIGDDEVLCYLRMLRNYTSNTSAQGRVVNCDGGQSGTFTGRIVDHVEHWIEFGTARVQLIGIDIDQSGSGQWPDSWDSNIAGSYQQSERSSYWKRILGFLDLRDGTWALGDWQKYRVSSDLVGSGDGVDFGNILCSGDTTIAQAEKLAEIAPGGRSAFRSIDGGSPTTTTSRSVLVGMPCYVHGSMDTTTVTDYSVFLLPPGALDACVCFLARHGEHWMLDAAWPINGADPGTAAPDWAIRLLSLLDGGPVEAAIDNIPGINHHWGAVAQVNFVKRLPLAARNAISITSIATLRIS